MIRAAFPLVCAFAAGMLTDALLWAPHDVAAAIIFGNMLVFIIGVTLGSSVLWWKHPPARKRTEDQILALLAGRDWLSMHAMHIALPDLRRDDIHLALIELEQRGKLNSRCGDGPGNYISDRREYQLRAGSQG